MSRDQHVLPTALWSGSFHDHLMLRGRPSRSAAVPGDRRPRLSPSSSPSPSPSPNPSYHQLPLPLRRVSRVSRHLLNRGARLLGDTLQIIHAPRCTTAAGAIGVPMHVSTSPIPQMATRQWKKTCAALITSIASRHRFRIPPIATTRTEMAKSTRQASSTAQRGRSSPTTAPREIFARRQTLPSLVACRIGALLVLQLRIFALQAHTVHRLTSPSCARRASSAALAVLEPKSASRARDALRARRRWTSLRGESLSAPASSHSWLP